MNTAFRRIFVHGMLSNKKLIVGVVFGGRSGEHEVSLVSARSIISGLESNGHLVRLIGITRDGRWFSGNHCLEFFQKNDYHALPEAHVSIDPTHPGLVVDGKRERVDVYFPVLHGPYGEDGTIQGYFEMARVPYVGADVFASACGMDKIMTKRLWKEAGLPVVPFLVFSRKQWGKNPKEIVQEIISFGLPCFVKPARLGSSVGITKVKAEPALKGALTIATTYDSKILVEQAVHAREIECAVLGNDIVEASLPGEVIPGGEFYDFYDKYINEQAKTIAPAELPEVQMQEIQDLAKKAYKAIDCSGYARVDFLMDRATGKLFLNEINTIPGFTSISMFPKMWEASGLSYKDLIQKLLDLSLERFSEHGKTKRTFDSGSTWYAKG